MKKFIKKLYISLLRLTYRPKIKKYIQGVNNQLNIDANIHELSIKIVGHNNTITFDPTVTISKLNIYLKGNQQSIMVKKNCYLGDVEFWLEDDNVLLEIGEKTTIEQAHLAVTEQTSKLSIGNDCMLARGIEIRTGDSHAIYDLCTHQRINKAKDVILEDHVWIGSGAKLLKGSYLKSGSIVATGAIVTGEIPENSIASGIPAKVIKQNVKWTRER